MVMVAGTYNSGGGKGTAATNFTSTSDQGGDGRNLGQNGQNGFGGGNAGTGHCNQWLEERQGSAGSGYAQNNIRVLN